MRFRFYKYFVIIGLLSLLPAIAWAQATQISLGLDYLAQSQNTDGSWGGTAAAINDFFPSTSTAVDALKLLETTPSNNRTNAINYLSAQSLDVTDYLSRRIVSLTGTGADTSADLTALDALKNPDGGWGGAAGFTSGVLDAALALQALGASGGDAGTMSVAVNYLLAAQNTDGGWGFVKGDWSDVYYTAIVMQALETQVQSTTIANAVTNGAAYLVAHQNPDGGIGNSPSTVPDTALALMALARTTSDATARASATQYVLTQQLGDGSWDDDPYSTALALQALYLVENLPTPVSATNGQYKGIVVDNATGVPIAGAQVALESGTGVSGTTASDGTFTLVNVPPGSHTITYQATGYNSMSQAASVLAGQVVSLGTIRLVALSGVGVISGILTNAETGDPIAGAVVEASGTMTSSATTTSDGSYSMSVAPGSVTITASADGFDPVSAAGTVVDGGTLRFSPALYPTGTSPGGSQVTVKGRVTDAETGQALSGASVQIVGTAFSGMTDGAGLFDLTGVDAGILTIDISSAGYQTARYVAAAAPGSVMDLGTIGLLTAGSSSTTTVIGTVTEYGTGLPVSGASVVVDGFGTGAVTLGDGSYRIEGIAGTQFNLTASAVGFFQSGSSVSLPGPGTITVNFILQRASTADLDIESVTTASSTYPAMTSAPVEAVLANTGSADRMVRLYLKAVDSAGRIVDQFPAVEVPLGGDPNTALLTVGANSDLTTSVGWNTARHPGGDYQVVVQAYDPSTGQLLAERGTPVEIQTTRKIGGSARFDPPIAQLAAKKPVEITASILNRGNVEIGPIGVTAKVTFKNKGLQPRTDLVDVLPFATGQGLNNPRGVDVDADGNIYVANTSGNSVLRISPDGTASVFATGFVTPLDVDLDGQGNLYVLNTNYSYVRIGTDGSRTTQQTGLGSQRGIKVLSDGRVLIVVNNALYEVTTAGQVNKIVSGGLANPMGIAVNSHGAVFIANRGENSISRYDNGELSTFVTGISQPYGITVDGQDQLFVTSFGSNSLVKVTPSGVVTTIATGLSGPYDVKIGPSGDFVVSNYNANNIVTITPGGGVSVLVPSTVNKPNAAAYDSSGNLYVGNYGSNNIARFSPGGTVETLAPVVIRPQEILPGGDGVDVLEGSGQVSHVTSGGTRTVLATGLSVTTLSGMVRASDGNGFLVSEPALNQIRRVDSSGQLSPYLGQQLLSPRGMKAAAGGDRYVLNSKFITKIDAAGVVSQVASNLNNPHGLAIGSDGSLYVSETTLKQILKIDPSGQISVLASTSFSPVGITITPQGDLLVAQYGGTAVYKVDSTGSVTAYTTFGYAIYYDLLLDDQGNLWATHYTSNRVSKMAPDGSQTVYTIFTAPWGIVSDGAGGVLVGGVGRVVHISGSGTVSDSINGGPITSKYIAGVSIGSIGEIWLVDTGSTVYLFDASGVFEKRYAPLGGPRGMAYANDGSLIVANGTTTVVRMAGPQYLPEVVGDGAYERVIAEPGQPTVLVTNGVSVKRLDPESGLISDVIGGLSNIGAVALSSSGGITVGDFSENDLSFYDGAGSLLDQFVGLVQPKGLLFDSAGDLLVSNGYPGNILMARSDGRTTMWADLPNVEFMWLESDDTITASQKSQIIQISPSGQVVGSHTAPNAYGLARTSDGNLFAASFGEGALYQFESDWSFIKVASGISNAGDVEADSSGTIYISDSSRGVVNRLNADGSLSLVVDNVPGATSLVSISNGQLFVVFSGPTLAYLDGTGARTDFALKATVQNPITGLQIGPNNTLYGSDRISDTIYKIIPTILQPGLQTGGVVFTSSATVPGIGLDDSSVQVNFGGWTPTVSGDYLVEVTANDPQTGGELVNTLHVGPNANGTLGLVQTSVLPGDRTVVGSLNVVGADSTSITHIDPQGTSLAASSGTNGRAVAANSDGNIYAASTNKIVRVAPDGTISDFVTGITVGHGLAVDTHDNIYAISGSNILKITPQAQVQTLATLAGTAEAVATDFSGRVYAVDSTNKLSRIEPDGTITTVSTLGISFPRGLTIDAFGQFYILNLANNIVRISPDGQPSTLYLDQAKFEFEGVNITADCSNNVLFAPTVFAPYNNGEEATLLQIIGDTGEVREVLYGPDFDPGLNDMDVLYYDRIGHRILIWTDLNNGRIYSLPVICGGINADAHIVTRDDVDLSSADPSPSSVSDLGNGTKEYIWSLADVDSRGFNIQLNFLFHNLTENEHRPAVQDAFLAFNNSFVPGESVHVPISIPEIWASSAMSLVPTLDASAYGTQSPVGISVTIQNQGGTAFDGNLALIIADSAGATVENLPSIPITALPGLSSIVLTNEWNTGSVLAGDYKVVASLLSSAGVEVAYGEVPFAISAVQQMTAEIVSDKMEYGANETATLNSTVTNLTTNSVLSGVSATVQVMDSSGASVFTEQRALSDLLPSSGTGFKSFWAIGTSAPGNYTAVLTVTTGTGLTATNSAAFYIASSLDQAKSLAGTISITPNGIIEGETTHLDYTVQNIGNVLDVPEVTLEILVVDPGSGAVVRTLTDFTSLNSREVFANGITFNSAGLEPANYLFILRGVIEEATQTLASAALVISPIPNTAPTANAGPDQIGFAGQPVTLDGTGSSDPEGDPLTYQWAFVSVPDGSTITDGSLIGGNTATPSFTPDINGSYILSLVVNDGTLDSQTDLVAVYVSPPIQIDLHPETINLKSNGGSTSVTVILFSPVLSSFDSLTDSDGVTVTATFAFSHTYTDKDGNAVSFTTPTTDYPGAHSVMAVDLDGDGTTDGYQLTLKIDRQLIIAGFTDTDGTRKITQSTPLTSTAIGNGLTIGSDTNTAIAPPK